MKPDRAAGHLAAEPADTEGEQFDWIEMYPLTQGIAHFEKPDDPVGKRLDHRDLEPEPKILHFGGKRFAAVEQQLGPCRKRMQALQQWRRRPARAERLDGGAGGFQRIARQVDAIEVMIVLAAVLQMIVDLQARAQRVRRRPGRGALAMDVEHEPADRHRRVTAIMNHFVPVLVTKLRHVHPEGDQDVEGVARRHWTFRQRAPQVDGLGLGFALAQQLGFEQIEQSKLVRSRERRMIGDVVGGPDEIVERKDQRAVARMNDPRRDRKVLVAVSLAGSQFARACHREPATIVQAERSRMWPQSARMR
jgi:hypothetical protein